MRGTGKPALALDAGHSRVFPNPGGSPGMSILVWRVVHAMGISQTWLLGFLGCGHAE